MNQQIEVLIGVSPDRQCLYYNGIQLENNSTLLEHELEPNVVVELEIVSTAVRDILLCIPPTYFNPEFDCDYRTMIDIDNVVLRGVECYLIPYGWYKYGLQVSDKYESNSWLGIDESEHQTLIGEWPVGYHGTSKESAESIVQNGYSFDKSKRFLYGYGMYTSPDVRIAESYSKEFTINNKTYLVVIQNRVNPRTLKKIPDADPIGIGEYWLSPNENDVRPYAVLIKEKL
eukprot:g8396.t1